MPAPQSKAQFRLFQAAAHGKAKNARSLSRVEAARRLAEMQTSYASLPARKKGAQK